MRYCVLLTRGGFLPLPRLVRACVLALAQEQATRARLSRQGVTTVSTAVKHRLRFRDESLHGTAMVFSLAAVNMMSRFQIEAIVNVAT